MGLFSVIKLANDYAKAKKFVENKISDKKVDIDKIKKLIERVKDFIIYLRGLRDEVVVLIAKAKETLDTLKDKLEQLKGEE